MKEIQNLNILMKGITINGPMFDIHDNQHVHIHSEQPEKRKSLHASEEEIKENPPSRSAKLRVARCIS